MVKEYYEDIDYTDNVNIITALDAVCQQLVKRRMAKLVHNTVPAENPNRVQDIGNGIGTFATKKFEIDREKVYEVYHYEPFSIFRPFDDTRKSISIKFWYNYKMNRAGVKASKSDAVTLLKIIFDILVTHNEITNNGSISIGQILQAAKAMREDKKIPVLPDSDQ